MGWKLIDKCTGHEIPVTLSENQCGMETAEDVGKAIIVLWLSENQCGMETLFQRVAQSLGGLSENQCGMETIVYWLWSNLVYLVEREPMWDDRSGCEWCVVSSEW